MQAEEYYNNGIDIRSQDTFIADELMDFMNLEDEDEEHLELMDDKVSIFNHLGGKEEKSDDFEDDTYFNISSDEEASLFKRKNSNRHNSRGTVCHTSQNMLSAKTSTREWQSVSFKPN